MMSWSVMPSTSTPAASSRALAAASSAATRHLQREVVDPGRRVGRGLGGVVVAEVEEGDVRAVAHLEEDVDVGAVLAGRRHVVRLDQVDQRQAEQVLVEVPGFLRVAAAPGEVVEAADGRHRSRVRRHVLLLSSVLWGGGPIPFEPTVVPSPGTGRLQGRSRRDLMGRRGVRKPLAPEVGTVPASQASPGHRPPHERGPENAERQAPLPRRPCRQPAAPARAARGARGAGEGRLDAGALRAVEDRCIRDAIAGQREAGLKDAYRRRVPPRLLALRFPRGPRRRRDDESDQGIQFQGGQTKAPGLKVTGPIRYQGHPSSTISVPRIGDARATPKITIPSPSVLHFRGGRRAWTAAPIRTWRTSSPISARL